jgi:aldose sugar dehydrogenase
MKTVAKVSLPLRIAFVPHGRLLVTAKIGSIGLGSAQGEKIAPLSGILPVYWQSQNGMLDVFVSPRQATDGSIYLTYIEPGEYGGSQALARAKLNAGRVPQPQDLPVIWRQMRGHGGQASGQVAISPDGEYIYMAVDDRQRMTPAQDSNQPVGKIVRLTLDSKPVPSNPKLREDRR